MGCMVWGMHLVSATALWLQLQQSKASASAHQQPSVSAAAVSVPVGQLSDAERQQLAHQYGYSKIGKQLPDGVTLSQIVKSMPSQVTQPDCWCLHTRYIFEPCKAQVVTVPSFTILL